MQNVTPLSANGPSQEVSPGFGHIPHVPRSVRLTLVGFSVRPCGLSPGSGQLGSTNLASNASPLGADKPSKPSYFVTEPIDSPPSLGAPSSPSHSNSFNSVDPGLRPLVCSPIRGGSLSTGIDLHRSCDFMDLSLKRKAPSKDHTEARHVKLLK
ncbi:hypothetical protein LOK49_LG03G02347 [Camellia lanceoleosa]|uniref:Uncharacterized protein n=1 Tax=Camellia lanceoleosa TaxID=1840588 RepID=A0ACC0IDV3_9ERIC|nr:hypothetical protein LOK49_LG03G02347 [Camellia lanceoleosa]